MKVTFTTTVDVKFSVIASIICTAVEGGINYWCEAVRIHEPAEDLDKAIAAFSETYEEVKG